MPQLKPHARLMELPDLGPVCLLLNYEDSDDGNDWKVEVHFYHEEIAPSSVGFLYPTEEKATEKLNSIEPSDVKELLQRVFVTFGMETA